MRARLLSITAALLVAVAASAGAAGQKPAGQKPAVKKAPPASGAACTKCVEKAAVLDPKLFTDTRKYEAEVAPAYEVARKYPQTLDRLHCFCECQESMVHRHQTLLTCFTTDHAAGCGICIREALLAKELKEKGMPDDQIEVTVEGVFKTDGHRPTHNHPG
jgi:Protein of unknown function with PCYCGC motif